MLFFYVEILMFKEIIRILAVLSVRDRAVFLFIPQKDNYKTTNS